MLSENLYSTIKRRKESLTNFATNFWLSHLGLKRQWIDSLLDGKREEKKAGLDDKEFKKITKVLDDASVKKISEKQYKEPEEKWSKAEKLNEIYTEQRIVHWIYCDCCQKWYHCECICIDAKIVKIVPFFRCKYCIESHAIPFLRFLSLEDVLYLLLKQSRCSTIGRISQKV